MISIPLGVAIMATFFFVAKLPALKSINIYNFMTGAGYLSNDDFLLNQPINYIGLLLMSSAVLLAAIGLGKVFNGMDV